MGLECLRFLVQPVFSLDVLLVVAGDAVLFKNRFDVFDKIDRFRPGHNGGESQGCGKTTREKALC